MGRARSMARNLQNQLEREVTLDELTKADHWQPPPAASPGNDPAPEAAEATAMDPADEAATVHAADHAEIMNPAEVTNPADHAGDAHRAAPAEAAHPTDHSAPTQSPADEATTVPSQPVEAVVPETADEAAPATSDSTTKTAP
jgi:hypothetical protein